MRFFRKLTVFAHECSSFVHCSVVTQGERMGSISSLEIRTSCPTVKAVIVPKLRTYTHQRTLGSVPVLPERIFRHPTGSQVPFCCRVCVGTLWRHLYKMTPY